jgi:hypothetical protein
MSDMTRRFLLLASLASVALTGCGDDDGDAIARDMAAPDGEVDPDLGLPGDMGSPPVSECTAESMDSTLGDDCVRDLDCSDGCFCNGVELCMGGACVAGEAPCGRFDCSTGSCDEATRTCDETPDDSFCDDGVFCNGAERCDPEFGCRPGTPPFCGDGDICTVDTCDEAASMCTHAILDGDMDGAAARSCGGADCDDSTADRAPGNTEICDNGIDDDCNNRVDGLDPACAAPNDRCTDEGDGRGPLDITRTTDGTSVIAASTVAMDGDYDTVCGEASEDAGPDAVFSFTLSETKDVSVEVQGIGNNAILSLRTAEGCATDSEDIRCSDTGTGVQPFVMAHSLPAGDYAIVVITGTETAYDLAFTVAPPTTVDLSADSCGTTTLDLSAGGSFSGNFLGDPRFDGDELTDTHDIPCRAGSTSYRDVAFTLSVPSGEYRDVHIEAQSFSSTGTDRRPYLALVDDCEMPTGSSTLCVEAPSGGPAELDLRALPEGDYFVLLEQDFSSDEEWTLDATVGPAATPPAGDLCPLSSPVDITGGSGSIDLATLLHSPDIGPFCRENGAGSTDAFFEFTLSSPADAIIETTSSPTVRHMLAYSAECGVIDSEADCFSGTTGSSSRRFERLPAGTHYVNVTTLETAGVIEATLTIEPPTPAPPNNECAGATTLTPNTVVPVDLPEYDDNADHCGATRLLDAFYTFTLASETDVALRAVNAQRLTLLDGSCAGDEVCAAGAPPRIERRLAAGTYIVVVEADAFAASSDTQLYFSTF